MPRGDRVEGLAGMTEELARILGSGRVAYEALLVHAPDVEACAAHLAGVLPQLWADAYATTAENEPYLYVVEESGFSYVWDLASDAIRSSPSGHGVLVEDRLVAAHGRSAPSVRRRDEGRLRRRTRGAVEGLGSSCFDRGHVIGHSLGGGLDINIVPQLAIVNRGRRWRRLERYCVAHPGTYCFVRLFYTGVSAHPAVFEYGVLRQDCSLWVEHFLNTASTEDLDQL